MMGHGLQVQFDAEVCDVIRTAAGIILGHILVLPLPCVVFLLGLAPS